MIIDHVTYVYVKNVQSTFAERKNVAIARAKVILLLRATILPQIDISGMIRRKEKL